MLLILLFAKISIVDIMVELSDYYPINKPDYQLL